MARANPRNPSDYSDEPPIGGSSSAPVILAALVGMAVSAALGWMLSVEHGDRVRRELNEQVVGAVGQLRAGYRMADEKLTALASFYAASIEVTREEFKFFAGNGLTRNPEVRCLAWVPVVRAEDRKSFEAAAVRDGLREFKFRDGRDEELKPAPPRAAYAPLYFAEPAAAHQDVMGIDLFSIPGRRAFLDKARDSGDSVALRVKGPEATGRLAVFRPVYRRGERVTTMDERRRALQGYVMVMVALDGLLAPVLARLDAGLAVEFYSDGASPGDEPFHSVGATGLRAGERRAAVSETVELGGGRWRMTFTPRRDYFAGRPNAQTWIGVCLSLAFTTLVCAWIHSMAVRQRRVASVVDERTSELVIANAAMKQEVKVRRRAEEEIRRKTEELETVNRELESFSYSISHDLRAPLRAITGFAGFVLRKHADTLPADAVEHLQQVMRGGDQMNNLIEGLLQFSRIQRAELKRRNCDMSEMARGIMAELLATMPERRVNVIWGRLPPAFADPTLLRQVWQNLIGNALKYSGKRASAEIEIGAREEGGETQYYVSDNGAGFDMTQADRLFGVFQRFHAQSQFEGTGIGLANVHKIIQRHGGTISAEAAVDEGATFRFTLGKRHEATDLDESTSLRIDTRMKK